MKKLVVRQRNCLRRNVAPWQANVSDLADTRIEPQVYHSSGAKDNRKRNYLVAHFFK